MTGLARLAKMYGAIIINGQKFVWDYAQNEAVPEEEMTRDRQVLSERARWLSEKPETTNDH